MDELWAKAPANLIHDSGLTASDLRVYLYLDLRAGKRGWWHGTQEEIAVALAVSPRAVQSAVAKLRDRGYVTSERRGRANGTTLYALAARGTIQAPLFSVSDAQLLAGPGRSDPQHSARGPERSFVSGARVPITPRSQGSRSRNDVIASRFQDCGINGCDHGGLRRDWLCQQRGSA